MKRKIAWGAIALTAASLLLFTVSYLAAEGPFEVPKTVTDDPGLPSATIAGKTYHLETFGDPANPVVIMLHGGPGNDYRMLLSLKELADEYLVVYYDQQGAGLSPRIPDEELTVDGYVEDLHAIGNHFSAGRPIRLVGHSWGAMLASAYLGRYPGRVSHAVLAEPGFLTPELGEDFIRSTSLEPSLALLPVLWKVGMKALHVKGPDDDARLDYFVSAMATADVKDHPFRGYWCDGDPNTGSMEAWRFGGRATLAVQKIAVEEDGELQVTIDLSEGVENFDRPVLFMASSCNTLIGEARQREHMNLFPDARIVVIDDAGHTLFGEQPERSLEVIRDYFAGEPG